MKVSVPAHTSSPTPRARATAVLAALVLLASAPVFAQEMPHRTIVVGGIGEVSAVPDQAQLSAGVVTQAATAAGALDANSTAMIRVFEALRTLNIPDNKIQTSNLSVSPQYPPFRPDNDQPRTIVGYQVSNQVVVILDDVSKVGVTADALVRVGVNELNDVSFSIADPKPFAEQARRAAVEDAMAKATTLAAAAGVTLGPVMTIQEGSVSMPAPMMMAMRAEFAGPPPVAAGEQTVRVSVTVTFAIQ